MTRAAFVCRCWEVERNSSDSVQFGSSVCRRTIRKRPLLRSSFSLRKREANLCKSCECCLRSLPKWVLVELQSKHARCWLKVRLGYNIKLEDFWSREWSEVTVQWNLTLVLQQILKYIPLTLFVLFLRGNASSQAVLQLWEYMQLKTLNTQE